MMSSSLQKAKSMFSWEGFAVGAILLLGFVFRLRQYLTGRSLWHDEAMLALNIVNRNFFELFQTLDYDQGAPIAFLLAEKILNVLFGEHEYVLRLFPFVVGVAGLGVFYLLLRRTVSGVGLLTGLTVFAVGSELIYYSSEVKQYTLDVAVSTVMLYLAYPLFRGRGENRHYLYLGLAGLLALWFSHPALFVLAGIGTVLFIQALQTRERLYAVIVLGITWLTNLGLLYIFSLRGLTENRFLREYWQENFISIPSWSDWNWFGTFFSGLLHNQLGITVSAWLVFLLLIFGVISLFMKNKAYASAFIAIFIFASIASILWLYPLGGRFSLFMVPMVIILISQTISELEHRLSANNNWNAMVAVLVGVYLLYAPTVQTIDNFINPKYYEHIRPTMAMLSEYWQAGDDIFISYGAVPAFRFYADRYGLGEVTYHNGELSDYYQPTNLLSNLEQMDGESRVWILMSHVYEKDDFNEKDYLLDFLDTIGKQKREFRSSGTSVYLFLYDLGQ